MKTQKRKSNFSPASQQPSSDPTGDVLLIKADEVCRRLGGLHPRSLARMEARGLIKSVPLIRHRLFAVEDVNNLVAELRKWNA